MLGVILINEGCCLQVDAFPAGVVVVGVLLTFVYLLFNYCIVGCGSFLHCADSLLLAPLTFSWLQVAHYSSHHASLISSLWKVCKSKLKACQTFKDMHICQALPSANFKP
jgi:hypothetical protein